MLTVMTLVAVALCFASAARADYHVVVSERSVVQALTRQEVLHLYMGRTRVFPDGSRAVTLDLADARQREGFHRALTGMSLAQVTSYWARLMFSGRNLPPQQLDDEAAMVARVRSDPATIGWLSHPPRDKGLRTVLVLKEAP